MLTRQAIQQYIDLKNSTQNYYIYNLRSANRNGLRETGEKLMELERFQDAVDILEFNVKVNPAYYREYNIVAKAWILLGNKEEAIKNYKISTTMYDDKEENEAFKELAKLSDACAQSFLPFNLRSDKRAKEVMQDNEFERDKAWTER